MRDFLEQAGDARRSANDIRRHLQEHEAADRGFAAKQSERLDAHAAELEYRWLTLRRAPGVAGPRWLWVRVRSTLSS